MTTIRHSEILKEKIDKAKARKAKLEEEISIIETQYRLNAERKAKKGSEAKLQFYERELASVKQKTEALEKKEDMYIEKQQSLLLTLKTDYEVKVNLLEMKLQQAKSHYESTKTTIEANIQRAEQKKKNALEGLESKITDYYNPVFKELLEPSSSEASPPPSYDKKKAELLQVEAEIRTSEQSRLICLEVEAEATKTPEEIQLEKMRAQARKEALEQIEEQRRLREEQEIEEYRRKREFREQEERLAEERKQAREQEKRKADEIKRRQEEEEDAKTADTDSVSVASEPRSNQSNPQLTYKIIQSTVGKKKVVYRPKK